MSKIYIGTKVLLGEPEEKDGQEGYKVIYPNPGGTPYVSWCPKEIFKDCYRELTGYEEDMLYDVYKNNSLGYTPDERFL
jgi:hypothetical protein